MLRALIALPLMLGLALPAAYAASPTPPKLIETIRGEQAIVLQSLHIGTDISGGLAQTTIDMVFYNPNGRQLEGNLAFPLLDGQRITAFALDINGKLRNAVPVEKAKGRQIFEAVERRQVDPGLLESTEGNNFRLRIYPIPAHGTRSVRLQYAESMTRQGKEWVYRLPMGYGDGVRDFDLAMRVHGATQPPRVDGTIGALAFAEAGDGYQARVTSNKIAALSVLEVKVPAQEGPRAYTEVRGADTYFIAEVPVADQRAPRTLPGVIGLLWDSSGSGAQRNVEAELAVLDAYFKRARNADVRLTRLRDRAEAVQSFRVTEGNWQTLRLALLATKYDGASALGAWTPQSDVGEYLLVSDGLNNYGNAIFPSLRKHQRLFALNSSLSADSARLAAWAENGGGRLIDISSGNTETAINTLLTEGSRVVSVNAPGTADLQLESHDVQNGMVRVAGRLRANSTELLLTLMNNGKPAQQIIKVSANDPAHPLAGYMWAGYRLRALDANRELARAEIRRIGQQFGLTTREPSLIVLDAVEDYVQHDVQPPPELQAAFDELKQRRSAEIARVRQEQLSNVVQQFERRNAWWSSTFPKDDPRKAKEVASKADTYAFRDGPVAASAAPAPRPAPAAMSPSPSPMAVRPSPQQSSDLQQVQVTGQQSRTSAEAVANAPALSRGELNKAAAVNSIVMLAPNTTRAEMAQGGGDAPSAPQIGIALKKWTANAPYMQRLKSASPDTVYAIYLDEKPSYANSSAFFLDVADILIEKGQRDLALRVLSNLAEMELDNRAVLRILGYRLLQAGAPALAIPVFQKVVQLAEEEPQSFRDLGLAYAANKEPQKAVDQLAEVLDRHWDDRFDDIESIVLAEMNAIIATAPGRIDTSRIDPRLIKNMPLDVRVVMTWDADNSDMDLWVTDPNGEKCYYGHNLTYQGGMMSRDFTQGYGPEEFSLRFAKPGKYRIETNFYGNRQQVVAGATTLQVKVSTGFGTAKQKDQMITLRLKDARETVFVGEFEVKP